MHCRKWNIDHAAQEQVTAAEQRRMPSPASQRRDQQARQ
jgi:hypothetical protein